MIILKDQIAFITGATSGIGRSIAVAFAKAGAHVVAIGTNPERGSEVLNEIKESNPEGNHRFFSLDVASFSAVQTGVEELLKAYGRVDVLINCAGITRDALMLRMTEEDWDQVLEVNLKSAFNLTKACVRSMVKAKKGKILNISSVVGIMGNAGQANYAASKAGMIGFTKALAKELAGRVQVNCIAPGYIETKMTDQLTSSQKEAILQGIPMGRIGRPEEIAYAALFLASPLSDYITGQVLAVDGGMAI
jgi:3-oxoacyl-[acyl-carrier protein] reductase